MGKSHIAIIWMMVKTKTIIVMLSITFAIVFSRMMVETKTMIMMVSITFAIASSPVWEAAHGNPDPLEDTVARELVHDQGSFHLKTKSGD